MKRGSLYVGLLAGWVALTITLTSIPNPEFGPSFHGADKIAHFGFYGVAGFLCALWRRESGEGRLASALYATAFVALLGAVDEIHQYWIPGRSMEFFDWAADFAGGTAGGLCSNAAVKLFPVLLSPNPPPSSRSVTD